MGPTWVSDCIAQVVIWYSRRSETRSLGFNLKRLAVRITIRTGLRCVKQKLLMQFRLLQKYSRSSIGFLGLMKFFFLGIAIGHFGKSLMDCQLIKQNN